MAEARNQSSRLWFWRGSAVVVVLVFIIARYLLRDELPVRVVRVAHETLVNTVSTNGHVEPEVNYPFYSPVSTTVKAVYVQPGDHVAAGKLLMVLDDVSARAHEASAQSGVKAAQAALDAATHNGTQEQRQMAAADIARSKLERNQAQHDLDALTKLNSTGAASGSEVAAARQRLDTTEAALHAQQESATSRYSSAEVARAQAALADAEANLRAARQVVAETAIHAPVAGTVYTISVSRGDYAEQGRILLEMADLDHVRVRAYFDEPEIGRLAVGQKILIKWDARQGREWHGHIVRAPATVITFGTRNVGEVLVALDDPDGGLLPDTNVNVTVTLSSDPNAMIVPRESLRSENGKPYVFKVVDNSLARTPVVTGIVNLTQVAIVSGLQDGDEVATGTTSGQPLQAGVPIKALR